MLFGETEDGPDVLIVQRSPWLRRHAGQPAFPGGAVEAADHGPVGAALREAAEEAGVDPAGVEVLAVLPELYISRSGFSVIPVLAWWRRPVPVTVAADGEVTAAVRVPLADLADPANRLRVRHPSGSAGPAFACTACSSGGSPPSWWTGCWRSAAGSGPGTRGTRKTSRPMSWSPPPAASARGPNRVCDTLVSF